jgi:hypothetical protein
VQLYQDVGALVLELFYHYVQVYFPQEKDSAIKIIQESMTIEQNREFVENKSVEN